MSTERDTHFAGFVDKVWDEVGKKLIFWIDTAEPNFTEEFKLIFAQHAYDLVWHALDHTEEHKLWNFKTGVDYLEDFIPDFVDWPEDPEWWREEGR